MSALIALQHEIVSSGLVHTVHDAVSGYADFKNPKPKAPNGVGAKANDILAYVKWGALFVIIAAGFIGAGAVAAGHFLSHQKSSLVGVRMLIGAVAAAVLYAGIFAFITSMTG